MKITKLLTKLNPFNLLEEIIIKRIVKKVISLIPELKEDVEEIVKNTYEEILQKIKLTIIEVIKSYNNK